MLSLTLLVLVGSLSSLQIAFGIPNPSPSVAQSISLIKRQLARRTAEDWAVWAWNEREALKVKYGGSTMLKRGEGTNLMINLDSDSSYIGSLAIGTPPTSFYVSLDTGSSDLWVVDKDCDTNCSDVSTYNSASSSTFQNLSHPFSITYALGQAAGNLVSDVVQMAGFKVMNQSFGAVTQATEDLVSNPVSGLLGLAWQNDATSRKMPFWQTLASQGAWSQPVMGFQLTRFSNDSNTQPLEPGGSFTMGFVNSSLYTGNIDYQNLVMTRWWVLSLTKLIVQGSSVSLPSGSASYAAIDTGTTLVGGPLSAIQKIYAQIPGSQAGSGDWQDHWTYPCDTQVNVAMAFGGRTWPVSPADFQFTQIGPNQCVGAFFAFNSTGKFPSWIIGDAFLKNVYSVFRYDPASVGFAELSETALSMNGANAPPPSATTGSVVASVTAPASDTTSGALWTSGSVFGSFVVACGVAVGAMTLL